MSTSVLGTIVADIPPGPPPKRGCSVDGGGGAGLLVAALVVGLALRRRLEPLLSILFPHQRLPKVWQL